MFKKRHFSTSLSKLYKDMKYERPDFYNKVSPLTTMEQNETVDPQSFDLLHSRFVSGDWGSDLK
jgi:hypothetical protein